MLPPWGSIRNICTHIILAIDYNLLVRVEKKNIDPEEIWESIYTLNKEDLFMKWAGVDEKLLEYSINIPQEEYTFPSFLREGDMSVNSCDFFMQYILHTQHHRGQITSALRVLGKEVKTTDYLFYLSYLEG